MHIDVLENKVNGMKATKLFVSSIYISLWRDKNKSKYREMNYLHL